MTYTVKYKRSNDLFWKTLKKVKGDGIMPEAQTPTRFFITETEERIEIPIPEFIFKFSSGRFLSIKQRMEEESAQDLKLRK